MSLQSRTSRLERLAVIAFGCAPAAPTQAAPGWQRRLSAALGLGPGAGEHAQALEASPSLDLKALTFATQLRERMQRDLVELEAIEATLRTELAAQPIPLAVESEEMTLA